jgi:hypothetical protein
VSCGIVTPHSSWPSRRASCSSPAVQRCCADLGQGPALGSSSNPLVEPGLESEAKPAAATPADNRGMSNSGPIRCLLSCLDGLPSLGRCRPAGASILTCRHPSWLGVSASFVFWSPRRSLSHHHTYLATTTLSTTLCCHGPSAPCLAKEPLYSLFLASTRCCLTCRRLLHKATQRHVNGLQSTFNTAPDCLCCPLRASHRSPASPDDFTWPPASV